MDLLRHAAGAVLLAWVAAATGATTRPAQPMFTAADLIEQVSRPQPPGANAPLGGHNAVHRCLLGLRDRYTPAAGDAPALLAAMRSEKRPLYVRLCAARYLLALETEEARRFIRTCLLSADEKAFVEAASALRHHAKRDRNNAWALGLILEMITTGPFRPEAEDSSSGHSEVFTSFCWTLGEAGYRDAIPRLKQLLRERPSEASHVAEALGLLREPSAVPLIVVAYDKCGPYERWRLTLALGQIGTPEAIGFLISRLGNPGEGVPEALAITGSAKALEALQAHLKTLKRESREYAPVRIAIARLGGPGAADRLLGMAEDEREPMSLRVDALATLRQLDAPALGEHILRLYDRAADNPELRVQCLYLLEDVPGDPATQAMIRHALRVPLRAKTKAESDLRGTLLRCLNERLGTSFQTFAAMQQHLRGMERPATP